MNRETNITFSLILFLFANLAQAESVVVKAGIGYATVSEDSFKSQTAWTLAIEKSIHSIDVLLEGIYFGHFESKNSSETYVKVRALNPAIGKSFPINKNVNILGMSGISLWKAEATLASKRVGSDSDISPWIGTGIKSDIFGSIHLYGTAKYFNDISGGNIQLYSLEVGKDL